ncbi:hypothetical protein GALMADRAFT_224139 [Galerina marginata CBS 339.88]|uniref:Uncharacterized protein n=1 Tax=Galerina marginata (strain CBS 339.88) TaxID=685588 RepID=A0A067TG60_GALM3|nr:hypothetical protein GALMADRAFT_224139 [Galerina marginata CBS 339.88]
MPRYSATPTTPQSVNPVNVSPMSYGNGTPPQLPRGVHPTLVASPSGLSLNRPMPPPEATPSRPVDVAQPQTPSTQNPGSHNSGGQGTNAAFGNTSTDVEHPPTTTKHQRPKPISTPLSALGTFTNPPLASNVPFFRFEAVNSCAAPLAERRVVTNNRVKQAESTPMLAVQPQNGECMAVDGVSDLDHSVLPSQPVASPTHEPRLPSRKPPQSALQELFLRIEDLKAMIKDAESREQRQMYQGKLDNFLAESHQILCPRPSVFKTQPSRGTPVINATPCHGPKPSALPPPHSSNCRKVTLWPSASSHSPEDPLTASSPMSSSTPLALVEPERPRPRAGKKKVASTAKGRACGEQMLVGNQPDVAPKGNSLARNQPVACPSRPLTDYSEGMTTPSPVITSFRDAKKTPKLLRDLKQLKVLRDKIEGILDGPHPPPPSDFELQSYQRSGTPVLPLTAPHTAMHNIPPPRSAKDPKTMTDALERFAIFRSGDAAAGPITKQMNAKKKTTARQSTSAAQRNDGSFDAPANSGDAPASSSDVPMQRSMSGLVLSSSKSFSVFASQTETSFALSEGSQKNAQGTDLKINRTSERPTRKNYSMPILPDAEMQIEIESVSLEADYVAEMDAVLGNAFLPGDSQNMSSTDDLSTVFSPYGPTYHQDGDPVVDYEYDDILQFPFPFLNLYQGQDQPFFGSFPSTHSSSESANDTLRLHKDEQLFSLDRPTEEFNPFSIDSSGSFGHRPQIEGNETIASILPIESGPTISEIADTDIPFRRTEESNVDSSGSYNMNKTTVQQSPVGSVILVPQPLASSKLLQFPSNSTLQVPPLDSSQLEGSRALDATGALTHETISDRKSNKKQPQKSIDSGGANLAFSALSDVPTMAATGVNNVNASTWLVKTNRSGSALQYNTDTAGLVFALGKNNESVKDQAVPSSFDNLQLGVDLTNTTQGSPRADAQTEDQKGDAGASTASSPLGEHTLPEPGPNPPHMPPPVYIPTRSKYAHSGPEQWRFSSFPAPKVTLEVQDVEMADDELKEEDIPVASGQTPYVHTVQVVDDPTPMDVDVPEVDMLFDTSEDKACFHCYDVDIEMADAEENTYLSLIDIEMDDDMITAYSPGASPALTSHVGHLWGDGQPPSVAGPIEFAGSFVVGNSVSSEIGPSKTPEEPVEMDVVLEDKPSAGESHEKDAVPESPCRMAPQEPEKEDAQDSEKENLSERDELAPAPHRLARNGAFDNASASPKKIEPFNFADEVIKPCGLRPEISYTEKSSKTSSVSGIPEEQPKHKADPSKQKKGAFRVASQTKAFKASHHRPARKTQKAALSIPKPADVDNSPTTFRSVYRKASNGPLLGPRVIEVAEQCESRGLSGPTSDETTSSINSATIDPENELRIPGAYPEYGYPSSELAGYRGFIYTWFQTTFRAAPHRCL